MLVTFKGKMVNTRPHSKPRLNQLAARLRHCGGFSLANLASFIQEKFDYLRHFSSTVFKLFPVLECVSLQMVSFTNKAL